MNVTLRESKAKLSELVNRASAGEEIIITVRGKPAARLAPVTPVQDQENMEQWANVLRERAATYTVHPVDSSEEILHELREDRC